MEDWEIRKAEELWIKMCNNEEACDAFSKEEQKILEEWKLSEDGQRIISAWIKKNPQNTFTILLPLIILIIILLSIVYFKGWDNP